MLKKSFLLGVFIFIAVPHQPHALNANFEDNVRITCMAGFISCFVCCMLGVKANINISKKIAPVERNKTNISKIE